MHCGDEANGYQCAGSVAIYNCLGCSLQAMSNKGGGGIGHISANAKPLQTTFISLGKQCINFLQLDGGIQISYSSVGG